MIDVESGRELWARSRDNFVFLTVAFRADGEVVATGSQDTSIRLWDAESGKEIAILRGHEGYVDFVAFSPDGEKMASWGRDGQLLLWDLSVAPPTHRLLAKTTGGAAFSPDGRWIASGGRRRSLSSGKRAREQKPANLQETILLLAPLAALQTKSLRPYAEVSWRLKDCGRLMKKSPEKRGCATRVVHRDINTRPSSSRFLIRQTNYDNFVSPNKPRTRCGSISVL
jgi:WD40 repeat protein